MSNEISTRAPMDMAEFKDIVDDFKIDNSDIMIPKILLMQPSSEMVADTKAMIGDFRNSVTAEKVGSIIDPFLYIPFHYTKLWDIIDVANSNAWVKSEDYKSGADDALPWEFEEGGKKYKRVKRLNFFGFIPGEIEKGNVLPMVLSFKSTGYREGTKILTQMKLNISQQKLPWDTIYAISGDKRKNEDNQTYCVPKVEVAGQAHEDHLKLCFDWYKNMKNMTAKVIVDDSDVAKEYTRDAVKDVSDTGKF